jgi:hypothetical protein
MKQTMKRVFSFTLPGGGLGLALVLLALHHASQVLASGPLFYCSDRAVKESIAPAEVQAVLTGLVKR